MNSFDQRVSLFLFLAEAAHSGLKSQRSGPIVLVTYLIFWQTQHNCYMNIVLKTSELDPFISCSHEKDPSLNDFFKHDVGILEPKDLKISYTSERYKLVFKT